MKLSGVQVKSALFMNFQVACAAPEGKPSRRWGMIMQKSISAKPAQPVKTYEITHALRNWFAENYTKTSSSFVGAFQSKVVRKFKHVSGISFFFNNVTIWHANHEIWKNEKKSFEKLSVLVFSSPSFVMPCRIIILQKLMYFIEKKIFLFPWLSQIIFHSCRFSRMKSKFFLRSSLIESRDFNVKRLNIFIFWIIIDLLSKPFQLKMKFQRIESR